MKRLERCVVIATNNPHKLREIKRVLGRLPWPVRGLAGFGDFPPVRETGKTLEANALLKARAAARRTGRICLSDDTGLEVKSLQGAPGVFSARFAGPRCDYDDNNRKLLRLLGKTPLSRRAAVFRCVVAMVFPGGRARVFEGACPGRIPLRQRGNNGFGYDPVFEVRGRGKTFAEMTLRQKNAVSHRFKAFRKAGQFLKSLARA